MANVPISNLTTTWNDGATTFSGVKLNVTDTASASGSLLMDLQVGGTSSYKFGKGQYAGSHGLIIGSGSTAGGSSWPYLTFDTAWGDFKLTSWGGRVILGGVGFSELLSDGNLAATPTHFIGISATNGTVNASLFSDNTNCFDQRNSTNAQTFRLYGTADGSPGSNYRRLALTSTTAGAFTLSAEGLGTGATGNSLAFATDGTTRLTIADTGAVTINSNSNANFAFKTNGVMEFSNVANTARMTYGFNSLYPSSTSITLGTAGTRWGGVYTTLVNTSGNITFSDAANLVLGTTTGTKIGTATSQKLAFWNATPVVQPTTGITAGTFVANTSGIADDTATFDGYTIGQVVAALRQIGVLA